MVNDTFTYFTQCVAGSLLIACLGTVACSSVEPDALPTSQIELASYLAHRPQAYQRYVQLNGEEVLFEQEQWGLIRRLDSLPGYQQVEVYNVYEAEDGTREYYVLEFALDTTNTASRQSVLDYQVVVEPDTAYIQLNEENTFQLKAHRRMQVGNQSFEVYKLWGYAHPMDTQPVHHKYWTPRLGTLMIYAGKNDTFELVEGNIDADTLSMLQASLKQAIREARF